MVAAELKRVPFRLRMTTLEVILGVFCLPQRLDLLVWLVLFCLRNTSPLRLLDFSAETYSLHGKPACVIRWYSLIGHEMSQALRP